MTSSRTSLTLLESLRDARNDVAWQRFDAMYRPMLVAFGRRLGLDVHDAEDAAQRTVMTFCTAHRTGKYNHERGRLKHWLLTVVQNEIRDLYTERARQPLPAGRQQSFDRALRQLRDSDPVAALWAREWHIHLICECLRRARALLQPRDLRVFRMTAVEGRAAPDVARVMGMTPEAVRQVKHRALTLLRSAMADVESEW